MIELKNDPRFKGIEPFERKLWLSSPTMHGDEKDWVDEAILTNWVSTVGANINEIEKKIAEYIGCKYAVALTSGTAAVHLATKLAAENIYGQDRVNHGVLEGKRVFCTDVTFDASVNQVAYENGEAVFVDTEPETWNMSPEALEKAFEIYPDVKIVVVAHLYGTPARMKEIKEICERHGAVIVEDAAESLGAKYLLDGKWVETGTLGNYNALSFNGNKIITGSSGGMFLTDSKDDADRVRKWSTQSREIAPWYQHEELGYNYRMSNLIAGVVRGQLPYLKDHIEQKRAIYERYKEGFKDLPVKMNPFDSERTKPNFWLSCMIIDKDYMVKMERSDRDYWYRSESGKSCPDEILEALKAFNAEGRPIWKPMHMQPIYRNHPFITADGEDTGNNCGSDIFHRGLCLPSDNKMTAEDQAKVIDIIHRCFG